MGIWCVKWNNMKYIMFLIFNSWFYWVEILININKIDIGCMLILNIFFKV